MLWCAGIVILLCALWLVARSPLPGVIKTVLELVLLGFVIPGAKVSSRRVRRGRSPWSKQRPERG